MGKLRLDHSTVRRGSPEAQKVARKFAEFATNEPVFKCVLYDENRTPVAKIRTALSMYLPNLFTGGVEYFLPDPAVG